MNPTGEVMWAKPDHPYTNTIMEILIGSEINMWLKHAIETYLWKFMQLLGEKSLFSFRVYLARMKASALCNHVVPNFSTMTSITLKTPIAVGEIKTH